MRQNNKTPKIKNCPNCDKEFVVNIKNPTTKYCCHECAVNHLFRGKKLSEEHKLKIKLNHSHYWIGKKHTEEQIKKETVGLKKYQSGSNHWNWKGGITPLLRKLRFVKKYYVWRTTVFERDRYTCVLCGQISGKLNADHIIRFAELVYKKDWKKLWDVDNGRTLCVDCHRRTDSYARRFVC
jgi:endogenous inhibitor of DNA gyrase (YacG/DUF329 family)